MRVIHAILAILANMPPGIDKDERSIGLGIERTNLLGREK
jgi:hypothetical protein